MIAWKCGFSDFLAAASKQLAKRSFGVVWILDLVMGAWA